MTGIDREMISVRLTQIRELLADLEPLHDLDAEVLDGDRMLRHGIERVLSQLVDLAVGINTHVIVAYRGTAPATYRQSFVAMGELGVLSPELAHRLAPSAGLRNVLAHEYVDVDLQQVASAVPLAVSNYGKYVRQIAFVLLRPAAD